MKRLIILLMLASPLMANAQTRAEWTRQKATQIKYLYQQLAALQVYAGHLKDGYTIVRKGLTTVKNIRNGEWRLHEDFFEALHIVNPAIRAHPQVAGTLLLHVQLLRQAGALRRQLNRWPLFTPAERTYIQHVCDHLLGQSDRDGKELLAVITNGSYQISDAERIRQVEKLFEAMQEKHRFLQSFSRTVASLASGKEQDIKDIQLSKRLNARP